MRIVIDTDKKKIELDSAPGKKSIDLYSKEGFEYLSDLWVKVGWNEKYSYTFSWLGRPIVQMPEDMIRMQEVIFALKPDLIIETGIAHGGSLVYYASLCKLLGKGRVIGVDVDIRPSNRKALEDHELFPYITLIQGSSVAENVLSQIASHVKPGNKVLVILDSDHSKKHVLAELEAYKSFVSVDSYIVATDGIMKQVADVPRGKGSWDEDNPTNAAIDFSKHNPAFVIEQPKWVFNESQLSENITHWPGAWLRRTK